mgnify:CR=1 FL=1
MAPTRLFPYHRNTDYLVNGTSSGGLASLDDFFELSFLWGRRLVEQREAQETSDRAGTDEVKRFVNEKELEVPALFDMLHQALGNHGVFDFFKGSDVGTC